LGPRPSTDGILMLLEERADANEIAVELRRHGHDVHVVEVDRRTDWVAARRSDR
jgi:hypothetical protein